MKLKLTLILGGLVLTVATLFYIFQTHNSSIVDAEVNENIINNESDKKSDIDNIITNLKLTTSNVQTNANSNDWDISIIDKLFEILNELKTKLIEESELKESSEIKDSILETDRTIVNLDIKEGILNYKDLKQKQKDIITLLNNLKTQIGITEVMKEESKDELKNNDVQPSSEEVTSNELDGVSDYTNNGIKIYTESFDQEKRLVEMKEQVKNSQKVKTLYGTHTYGCRDQAEYDEVIAKAKEASNGYSSVEFNEYYYRYMNGERPEQYPEDSWEYKCLNAVKKETGYMMMKLGNEQAHKFNQVLAKANELSRSSKAKIVYTGKPNSAYDVLFRKLLDCDANAQVVSAVFDSAGYSTSVRYSDGHGWVVINVGGIWWDVGGAPIGLTGNPVPDSSPN